MTIDLKKYDAEELQEAWHRTRYKAIPLDYIVWDQFLEFESGQTYWQPRAVDEVKVWHDEMEYCYGKAR
jgi:hypothetical protein